MTGPLAGGRSNGAWRWAAAAAAALALFAILFTAGAALGAWPQLPPGAFSGWDLWVGMALGVVLLVYLLGAKELRVEGRVSDNSQLTTLNC